MRLRPILGAVVGGLCAYTPALVALATGGSPAGTGFALKGLHATTAKPKVPPRLLRCAAGQDNMQDRSFDWISGENFSRRAIFLFDTERSTAGILLLFTGFVAITALGALIYNGIGQVALMTSPGAKPSVEDANVVLIEALAGLLSAAGFYALSKGRTEILRRLDSEIKFSKLEVKLADGTGVSRQFTDLGKKMRVLALFGQGEPYQRALKLAHAYRQRWLSSGVLVVAAGNEMPSWFAGRWAARAVDLEAWQTCFQNFVTASQGAGGITLDQPSFILFGKSGRVRGSGVAGSFDELIGFVGVSDDLSILPRTVLPPGLKQEEDSAIKEVLQVHDTFYKALIEGDAKLMHSIWAAPKEEQSQEDRKRRVPWDSVLTDRANVLEVVGIDVVFLDDACTDAMVTSIEVCVAERSLFSEGGPRGKGTLLATKRFCKDGGHWRLLSHQTIPYCWNTLATQTLRSNSRGCILLKPTG